MSETEEATTDRTDQLADYVKYVVESLVDEPDAVQVTPSFEDDELFLDVEVADNERGRIIGKQGRLIRSLRVIVRASAGRDGTKATVELLEPDEDAASGNAGAASESGGPERETDGPGPAPAFATPRAEEGELPPAAEPTTGG